MSTPGFAAEHSLYKTSGHYHFAGDPSGSTIGQAVLPAYCCILRYTGGGSSVPLGCFDIDDSTPYWWTSLRCSGACVTTTGCTDGELVGGKCAGQPYCQPPSPPNWGSIRDEQCSGPGQHKYSAILWNIPSGQDWDTACKKAPGPAGTAVAGRYPTRCVNTGFNEWGEWYLYDRACAPPPPPTGCPSGAKCCETDNNGKCTLCIPHNAQCP